MSAFQLRLRSECVRVGEQWKDGWEAREYRNVRTYEVMRNNDYLTKCLERTVDIEKCYEL